MAAPVRSAVAPGFSVLASSRSSRSRAAIASRPAVVRTPPASTTARARRCTVTAASAPSLRAMWVSGDAAGVREGGLGQRGGEPGARRVLSRPELGPRQRGEEQHQAEIRIGRRPAGGGFGGGANRGPKRSLARPREGRADRRSAREEILVRRVAERGEGGDVAGLRGAHLQQAGKLPGGRHIPRL